MRVLIGQRGPGHHGVARHARTLARLLGAGGHEIVDTGAADVVHAQFTDGLWGRDIATAVKAYLDWSAGAARPLVVTLHDIPGADRDPARDARRARGYAQVAAASDGIVVSSRHEAAKVRAFAPGRCVEVIDLPLPPLPALAAGRPAWAEGPTLGVLGFVYPGKGHRAALVAAAHQDPRPRVVALGAVSPGHEDLLASLNREAEALGVDLVITGALSDGQLAAGMAAVTVAVAPSVSVSASASLLAWVSGLRRPLAAAGAYAREIDRRHPGLMDLFADAADLDHLVRACLGNRGRTHLDRRPDWPDTAGAHLRFYAALRLGGGGRPA